MTKRLIALVMALAVLLSFAACGGKDTEETTAAPDTDPIATENTEDASLKAIYDECAAIMPEMIALDADMMLDYCGIKAEDCVEFFVSICADSLRTDEIWLIKATDATAVETLKGLADARLKAKADESETYSPEQFAIVQKAKIVEKGDYFALLVSPDAAALEAIVNEGIAN